MVAKRPRGARVGACGHFVLRKKGDTLRVLKVTHRGSGYGRVLTDAAPTHRQGDFIRLESADMIDLAQLAADVLGNNQPFLPPQHRHNLAKWIVRFGCGLWGERPFLRECARALIWERPV